jgi:N-methylhydantoinase A
MRYVGQGYEIEVALPKGGGPREHFKDLPSLFARNYQQVFSTSFGDWPAEIVNWKVEATGPLPELGKEGYELGAFGIGTRNEALKGKRQAYVHDKAGRVECPIYDRYALETGTVLVGPALIEENESTCVIDAGSRVVVDDRFNLVAEIATG